MSIPITQANIENALRPWVGSLFLSVNSFAADLHTKAQGYAPYRQTLEDLRTELERYILTQINRLTEGSMSVIMDNYTSRRLNLRDIQWMTDDVMGVVFDCLTPFSMNFEKLSDYALRVESLSVLRVLYQKYASFFSEAELDFLIFQIRDIYPPERYEEWLPPSL